jgi:hypothetical protein
MARRKRNTTKATVVHLESYLDAVTDELILRDDLLSNEVFRNKLMYYKNKLAQIQQYREQLLRKTA